MRGECCETSTTADTRHVDALSRSGLNHRKYDALRGASSVKQVSVLSVLGTVCVDMRRESIVVAPGCSTCRPWIRDPDAGVRSACCVRTQRGVLPTTRAVFSLRPRQHVGQYSREYPHTSPHRSVPAILPPQSESGSDVQATNRSSGS